MSISARFRIDRGDFSLDVALQFPACGVSAIFGPSGSGKTTLLRAVAGLERAKGGYLKLGEEVWQDEKRFEPVHRRSVGYVFQEPSLFAHLSVRRNIEYGRRRVRSDAERVSVDDAVELLGIGPLLKRYPHQLSGGEQQRVAIARALATSPSVLLMDEPLASLDGALKQEIMPYLESLHQELEIPVLYVSHSKEEVMRMADYVVLLADGRVREEGSVVELFSRLDVLVVHEQDACCVVEGVVGERDEVFGLTYVEFGGGRFVLARDDLVMGGRVRLLIKAADVSLALERVRSTSIQNILPAVVERIEEEGKAKVNVLLRVGDASLIARVTRKSAVVLGVKPGMKVFAQIKSVAVVM